MAIIQPVRVKVTCLRSAEEAGRAVSFGAAAIGVATDLPALRHELSEQEVAAIASSVGDEVGTFLLVALRDPDEIAAKALRCGVNTIQIWDPLPRDAYARIRKAAPGISIAQSIHVVDEGAVAEALDLATFADALVLGSTNPEPPHRWTEQHGRTHDWEISRRIAEAVHVPVILSGGLTHRNVADAVRYVRPYGVEVCSGVRSGGELDTSLLVQFLEALGRVRPV